MNFDKEILKEKRNGNKVLKFNAVKFRLLLNHMFLNGFDINFNESEINYLGIKIKKPYEH